MQPQAFIKFASSNRADGNSIQRTAQQPNFGNGSQIATRRGKLGCEYTLN